MSNLQKWDLLHMIYNDSTKNSVITQKPITLQFHKCCQTKNTGTVNPAILKWTVHQIIDHGSQIASGISLYIPQKKMLYAFEVVIHTSLLV